jgi:hypothetical protein
MDTAKGITTGRRMRKSCTVRDVGIAVKAATSMADSSYSDVLTEGLIEMLEDWDCIWIWKSLRLVGGDGLNKGIIEQGLITDVPYIKETYPDLCLVAFTLGCSERKKIHIGSFLEAFLSSNADRGELLGLMGICLILLIANEGWQVLQGHAALFFHYMCVLGRIANIPPHRIPCQCRHSDILKNILVNYSSLVFALNYKHVIAH